MPDLDLSKVQQGAIEEKWYVALDDYIIDLAWSPDEKKMVAVTVEGAVILVEHRGNSAFFKQLGQHVGGANSVSWRPDGAEFATAGHDGLAKVWDGQSGELLAELDTGDRWVSKAVYNPKRDVLATAAGRHLKLWDSRRELIYRSNDHNSTIADVGWNPNGTGVVVAAYNGLTLHVPEKQYKPRKYEWKGSRLILAWSPDSKYIATGDQDSTVHFWEVKSGQDAQMLGFPTKVLDLSWESSGRWLATGGGSVICLWDCSGKGPAGRRPKQLDGHLDKICQLAFQLDGPLLASADAQSLLLLWNPSAHFKVVGGLVLPAPVTSLRWNRSGELAVGQRDGTVALFHTKLEPEKKKWF